MEAFAQQSRRVTPRSFSAGFLTCTSSPGLHISTSRSPRVVRLARQAVQLQTLGSPVYARDQQLCASHHLYRCASTSHPIFKRLFFFLTLQFYWSLFQVEEKQISCCF